MRWKLLVAALLFAASPAFADSTVPALTAGTTLTGTVLYGAQGGTLDRKFGMDTTLFGIATGNITINAASIGNALLTNSSVTVNSVSCALGGSCTAGLTALTGDGTASGNGSQAFTLATVNASPGATTCSNITTNGKGLVTANTTGSCSGGGGTGSGVDGGSAFVNITASCTLGTTAACVSHAIREVQIGTLTGAITVTLDSIANVAVGQSPVCINDAGQNVGATNTLTVTANAVDAIGGGSVGGSVGPFTTPGLSICFRPTATHNWTVEANSTTAVSSASSTQMASGLTANGLSYSNVALASGTAVLGTSSISSAACAAVVTVAATGTLTTSVVTASFNGDPTAVTGYIPSTSGMLTIIAYPTANNVNFKVCNNTSSSITPGAITLNWRVGR